MKWVRIIPMEVHPQTNCVAIKSQSCGNSSGLHKRHASGALERGGLDRCPEWTGGTVRLEPPLLRFVPKESGDEWEHERE
jgi:hypothetical protein